MPCFAVRKERLSFRRSACTARRPIWPVAEAGPGAGTAAADERFLLERLLRRLVPERPGAVGVHARRARAGRGFEAVRYRDNLAERDDGTSRPSHLGAR